MVPELLGHRNIPTTQNRTLLSGPFRFLGGELKQTADETLFFELALRRSDLSSPRGEETTAEIVKIG